MLRIIRLHGVLGRKFGKEYKFDVVSVAEAVKALCSQVNGFKKYLSEGNGRNKKFNIVVNNGVLLNPETSARMESEGEINLVPIVQGSGGSVGTILTGAALIGLAVWNPWSWATLTQYAVGAAGAGLVLGGVMTMLMKPPTVAVSETDKNNDRSYIFNGAVNTVQQGQPIPIGYGRLKIGSQVVSVNVSTAQVPV